jgi:hypothetical protein
MIVSLRYFRPFHFPEILSCGTPPAFTQPYDSQVKRQANAGECGAFGSAFALHAL